MNDLPLLIVAAVAALVAAGCTLGPGVAAAVAALVRLRRPPPILGPLFWHELARLARGGQQPKLRALYAGALLVGLFVTYLDEFQEIDPVRLVVGTDAVFDLQRMARFAERFFVHFAYLQLAAVCLATPVYCGAAITDEKDRGTLDFLVSSMLSNREIVAAKFTARLVYVGSLVLTGLPVLGFTALFGGVAPERVIGAFTVALMTVLAFGAFALYLGTRKDTLREVLTTSYFVLTVATLFGFCCTGCFAQPMAGLSPITATVAQFERLGPPRLFTEPVYVTAAFVAVYGVLAAVFVALAIRGVRVPPATYATAVARVRREQCDDDEYPDRPRREPPGRRPFYAPRLGSGDPLWWKERYFSGRLSGFDRGLLSGCGAALAGGVLVPAGAMLFVAFFEVLAKGNSPAPILSPLMKGCGFAAAVTLAPLVGMRTATSVARERQQRTLVSLFTLPLPRADVLWVKFAAPLFAVRFWAVGLAAIGLVAVCSGAVYSAGAFVAALVLAGFVPFAAALGIWLSVRCGTVGRAVGWLLGSLFVLAVAPLLLATLVRSAFALVGGDAFGGIADGLLRGVSVPRTVYHLLYRWGDDPDDMDHSMLGGLFAAAVYAVAAVAFWWAAKRAFRDDGRT